MLGLKNKKQLEITISNRTIARIILFLFGATILVRVLENMARPMTLIFMSFFLALALNPAVNRLSSKLENKSRVGATAMAYGAVMTLLISFFVLVVPPLVSQTTEFIREVPATLSELETQDSALGNFVREYELEEQIQKFADDWSSNLGTIQGPVLTTANRIIANVVSIVTVFVLTFMMLIEGPKWLKSFWKHVPADRRDHDSMIAGKMYKVVTSYVNGQVLVAAIGAVFALVAILIASTIYDVSINAIALAGIVFLFGLIPTIGAILGALVVTLFSLFASPSLAITLLVYFIVYQQVENATIQPYIQSRGNELTPMLVFIAAIMGIGLGGVLGGFVAIPIAGCIKVIVDDQLVQRDKQDSAPPSKSSTRTIAKK